VKAIVAVVWPVAVAVPIVGAFETVVASVVTEADAAEEGEEPALLAAVTVNV